MSVVGNHTYWIGLRRHFPEACGFALRVALPTELSFLSPKSDLATVSTPFVTVGTAELLTRGSLLHCRHVLLRVSHLSSSQYQYRLCGDRGVC